MVDVKTVKFMKMLEELAERSKNGIEDARQATRENKNTKIFYDSHSRNSNGEKRIVEDLEIETDADCNVIKYFGHDLDCEVVLDSILTGEGEVQCVKVILPGDEDIYVEDGEWYFVEK